MLYRKKVVFRVWGAYVNNILCMFKFAKRVDFMLCSYMKTHKIIIIIKL